MFCIQQVTRQKMFGNVSIETFQCGFTYHFNYSISFEVNLEDHQGEITIIETNNGNFCFTFAVFIFFTCYSSS